MSTQVSEVDYNEATENYLGWCSDCGSFTTSEVEPDAEEYECEDCGGYVVFGAEQALITGVIEIVPEAEEVE